MRVNMDIVKTFPMPIQRQVWEGVEIREADSDILLNFKQDHYAPAVGHLEVRRQVGGRM